MKWSLAPSLVTALCALPAQDKPATESLPQLRAAFALAKTDAPTALLAVARGGEPVLLTVGNDAAGKELTAQTLVPMLALAKWLAADAIDRQLGGKTDKASGEKLGDRELTVRELLDGVPQLPDYYVLDGGGGIADAALLRKCGAVAVGAGMQLRASSLGAPEFVLLESLAFGNRYRDWPSMLRSTLAPHVSGLDPVSADRLDQDARARTTLAAEDLAKLATAQPALLRTMLSLQNLGTWLQWRVRQETPLWNSARMGRESPVPAHSEARRLILGAGAFGATMNFTAYPSQKAALLWIGPPTQVPQLVPLRRAFEADLFGDEDAGQGNAGGARLVAGAFAAVPLDRSTPDALVGTRWRTTPGEGAKPMQLAFGATAKEPAQWTFDQDPAFPLLMTRSGQGFSTVAARRADGTYQFWLRPEPGAEKPTKLSGVLVVERGNGATAASPATGGAALPQYVEWVPVKD